MIGLQAPAGDPWWMTVPEAAEHVAATLGIVVGGIWAVYRFGLARTKETALSLDLTFTTASYEPAPIAFFDVCMVNKGSVRVVARKTRPAYQDAFEILEYACDLKIRRIAAGEPVNREIAWFSGKDESASADLEVDLLPGYFDPAEQAMDFWMEPGESYNLGAAVTLEPGLYLAKVTFAGAGKGDFWRRVFLVRVPAPDASAPAPATEQRAASSGSPRTP